MNTKTKSANKTKPKPQRAEPALNKAGWPAQPPSEGIRRASSVHDRKPIGRGAARGR